MEPNEKHPPWFDRSALRSSLKMNVPLYNLQDFINTLDSLTIKKLCIRSLRWGIGSLDYIDSLLIMEDNDKDNDEVVIAEVHSPATEASIAITPPLQPIPPQGQGPRPEWCVCGNCRNMPLEVEKVCCRKKNCDAKKTRFKKLYFDPHYLELSVKSSARERRRQGKEESCTIMCCEKNPCTLPIFHRHLHGSQGAMSTLTVHHVNTDY